MTGEIIYSIVSECSIKRKRSLTTRARIPDAHADFFIGNLVDQVLSMSEKRAENELNPHAFSSFFFFFFSSFFSIFFFLSFFFFFLLSFWEAGLSGGKMGEREEDSLY